MKRLLCTKLPRVNLLPEGRKKVLKLTNGLLSKIIGKNAEGKGLKLRRTVRQRPSDEFRRS